MGTRTDTGMSDFAAETVILVSESDHARTMKPIKINKSKQDNKQATKGNIELVNRVMP